MTAIVYVSVEFAIIGDYRNKPICGQEYDGIGRPCCPTEAPT